MNRSLTSKETPTSFVSTETPRKWHHGGIWKLKCILKYWRILSLFHIGYFLFSYLDGFSWSSGNWNFTKIQKIIPSPNRKINIWNFHHTVFFKLWCMHSSCHYCVFYPFAYCTYSWQLSDMVVRPLFCHQKNVVISKNTLLFILKNNISEESALFNSIFLHAMSMVFYWKEPPICM